MSYAEEDYGWGWTLETYSVEVAFRAVVTETDEAVLLSFGIEEHWVPWSRVEHLDTERGIVIVDDFIADQLPDSVGDALDLL